jgi:hypothetical protein
MPASQREGVFLCMQCCVHGGDLGLGLHTAKYSAVCVYIFASVGMHYYLCEVC